MMILFHRSFGQRVCRTGDGACQGRLIVGCSPRMPIRRAKLVCTLGPACDSVEGLKSLIDAGMDVARLNFSHGSHEEHGARLARLREASAIKNKPVAALQDLCGPKVRTGTFPGPFELKTGMEVKLREGDSE